MRRVFVIAVILAAVVPGAAQAVSGTCRISSFLNTNPNLGLDFPVPVANGLEMPIEFDEGAGTFSMQRDAWAARFGTAAGGPYSCSVTRTQPCSRLDPDLTVEECSPPACPTCQPPTSDDAEVCAAGAQFSTVGIRSYLLMTPGTVTGTIDRAGHVTLAGFEQSFMTEFEKPLRPITDRPTVSTGIRQTSLGPETYVSEGVALDFATGDVTIAGNDLLFGAPGSGGTNVNGLRMTCRLNPIPVPANLPAAPALKAAGKVKGETLTLAGKLTPGKTALTLDGTQDLFVRLAAGGETRVLVFVPSGKFSLRGRKLTATEPPGTEGNGTNVKALAGRKGSGESKAPVGGKVTVTAGKKFAKLALKVEGLDLSGFTGAGTAVTVVVGTQNATDAVAVSGSRFK
jgi:hypothetical protein